MRTWFLPLLLALISVVGFRARAEMSAITVAASVVSFNEKSVVVRVSGKKVTLPRSMVEGRTVKKGDAVLITFRGTQIAFLLQDLEGSRGPASEKGPKKK